MLPVGALDSGQYRSRWHRGESSDEMSGSLDRGWQVCPGNRFDSECTQKGEAMRTFRMVLLIVLAMAVLVSSQYPIEDGARILFIGNSLTNNGGGLDNWVEAAGQADNPSITIEANRSIRFATELSGIYNDGAARNEISTGDYDIVVLQGWDDPILQPDSFHKYIDLFAIDIRDAGAEPVLFMTWPIMNHGGWALTALINQYDQAGARIGAPVVHCGTVWWGMRRRVPPGFGIDTTFLFADAIHPSNEGQFLNSLCFYAFFTRKDPTGVDYDITGMNLDPALVDTLQARAWMTVQRDVASYVGVTQRPTPLTSAVPPANHGIGGLFLLNGKRLMHAESRTHASGLHLGAATGSERRSRVQVTSGH
ncbi:MAG: hypothetical protein GF331_11210 [Chitinivibrionales bacterium]|nr:hypothetical protein [Chitinivibrionales bacterium]